MKNAAGETIYIGKAKDLRKRVATYFSGNTDGLADKTRRQIEETDSVEFIVTDNEVEALILESNLIKKERPRYNIDLKDSFRYAYVLVTGEEYPRLLATRKLSGKEKGKVFGPYVFGEPRAIALGALRKIFKIRTCRTLPKRECLLYHIGQCTAPCIGKISREEYAENVEKAVRVLEGNASELLEELELKMGKASQRQKYEEALKLREQAEAISWMANQRQKMELRKTYDEDVIGFAANREQECAQVFNIVRGVIRQRRSFRFDASPDAVSQFLREYYSYAPLPDEIILANLPEDADALVGFFEKQKGKRVGIVVPKRGDKEALLRMVEKNAALALNSASPPALAELKSLLRLPLLPGVMECFDVSNLGEENAVASMVQFVEGLPNRDEYRRFRIRTVAGQDDFGAIKEVVYRRYYRLKNENAPLPDLVVIDGGKGQLHAAMEALLELGEPDVPVIALAKKNEEIFVPSKSAPVALDRKSGALKLLQAARDEAHRFAQAYHKLLRKKSLALEMEG